MSDGKRVIGGLTLETIIFGYILNNFIMDRMHLFLINSFIDRDRPLKVDFCHFFLNELIGTC